MTENTSLKQIERRISRTSRMSFVRLSGKRWKLRGFLRNSGLVCERKPEENLVRKIL